MSQKIAILTGIGGMDAEALTDILLDKNYIVVGTYRKTTHINLDVITANHENNPNLILWHCDINDKDSVKSLIQGVLQKFGRIDELYLLAAQSHVGISFSTPETSIVTNGLSIFYFLENIRLESPKTRIYVAMTSELLGGDPKNCPFDENSPFECRSPYAIGKELGVRLIKYYQQTYGLYATYGILFNHSNSSRNLSFMVRRATNSAARIALGKQKELYLGNLDFYRDEHWADFGCEMMWTMMQLEKPETFIICRGECFHGTQFLDIIFNYFNLNWIDYVKLDKSLLRANEVVQLVGNPQKAIDKLGWNPNRISFIQHLNHMCKYDYELESGLNPKRVKLLNNNETARKA